MEISQLSPWLLLAAPIVIVAGYTVFGLSGFGSTLVSVPILAHFLPVSHLVPMMVLLDLASSVFMGTAGREHVSKAEVVRIVPFMMAGFVLGATVLVGVPDALLRAALGVFALAVGFHSIFNPTLHGTISTLWAVPAGIIGGASATVFGAGGPIYATYLSGRLTGKSEIRSTISALLSISTFTRAIIYAVAGLLLHSVPIVGAVVLAPFAWLGLKLGHRIHVGLTQRQLRRAIGGLLVLTGGSLLVRVFVS